MGVCGSKSGETEEVDSLAGKKPSSKGLKARPGAGKPNRTKSLEFCFACRSPYGAGENVVKVFGHSWHVACYVCGACGGKEPIRSEAFLVNDKLLCEKHYRAQSADKCTACRKPILGQKICVGDGSPFHAECYNCQACGTSLINTEALEHNGHRLCRKDFDKLTKSTCSVCSGLLDGPYVVVLGEKRHNHCLTCHTCHRVIDGKEEFVECDNQVYCEAHDPDKTALVCAVCETSLQGAMYSENLWKEPFCERCEVSLRKCYICGTEVCRLVSAGEKGRNIICTHCSQPGEALGTEDVGTVLTSLKEIGIDLSPAKVLVKRQAKVTHPSGGTYSVREDKAIILVTRKALPRESALCALAHAAAQAFLGDSVSEDLVEPVAKFAEFHFLSIFQVGQGVDRRLREDAFYRRDLIRSKDKRFRKFESVLKQSGGVSHQVIKYVKTNSAFPPPGHFL